jgi:hypothetical protein
MQHTNITSHISHHSLYVCYTFYFNLYSPELSVDFHFDPIVIIIIYNMTYRANRHNFSTGFKAHSLKELQILDSTYSIHDTTII